MGELEGFLARWSRLKQASGTTTQAQQPDAWQPGAEPPMTAAEPPTTAAAPADTETSSGPPAVDPAGLPPIESITAGTRMEQFLQEGVPAELAKAALRAAWVADPVIRDFIGLADSQWDFNDPNAMPGFGPLEAGARSLAESTRIRGTPAETTALGSGAAPHSPVNPDHLPREGQVDEVWLSAGRRDSPWARPAAERLPQKQGGVMAELATASDPANASDPDREGRPGGRVHGSALPKSDR